MELESVESILRDRHESLEFLIRDYDERAVPLSTKPYADMWGLQSKEWSLLARAVENAVGSPAIDYSLHSFGQNSANVLNPLGFGFGFGLVGSTFSSSLIVPATIVGMLYGFKEAADDYVRTISKHAAIDLQAKATFLEAQLSFMQQYAAILWTRDAHEQKRNPFVQGFAILAASEASYALSEQYLARQRLIRNTIGDCLRASRSFITNGRPVTPSVLTTTYLALENARGGRDYLKQSFKTIPQMPVFTTT